MKNHAKIFLFILIIWWSKTLTKQQLIVKILLHLIVNRINGYTEESNGNKYLTLVPADKRKTH